MGVPEDVDADGVHAERLAHLDAVFPVFARDTRIMQFGGFHHKGRAVKQKGLVADFEGVLLRRCVGQSRHAEQE